MSIEENLYICEELMELLKGKFLIDKLNSRVPVEEILKGKSLILLLFSSVCCNNCSQFISVLNSLYEIAHTTNIPLEILYISLDKSEKDMLKSFRNSHGNWFAIPSGDDVIQILQKKYDVVTIPKVIVLSASGRIVSMDSCNDILQKGEKVLASWVSPYSQENVIDVLFVKKCIS